MLLKEDAIWTTEHLELENWQLVGRGRGVGREWEGEKGSENENMGDLE